jgi:uncharacterized membrane protein YhhN
MTGSTSLLIALAMVAAVGDWIAVEQDRKPAEYLLKPATLVLLVAAALALEPADGAVRAWFVAALVLSLVGDVFLMLPQDLFVLGLASFLLGHIAYVVGFAGDDLSASRLGVGLVIVAVAISIVGMPILRAVRAGHEPELAVPVLAYMLVISAMVACAIGAGNPLAIGGAALFYASDSLIAWNRFVAPTRRGRLAIISTYHLAQLGLVLSLI